MFTVPAAAQSAGAPAQQPPCEVAADDGYGYTQDRAIQVGGSPVYGAARQRRYLDSLRGPHGQTVTYKRGGAVNASDGTVLDRYHVTYDGLEKPVTLFLDWYHYTEPRLPRGFSCAGPINLGLPPVDPFQEMDQLRALARAQAATADWSPIPATITGKPPSVVIYDRLRLLGLAARLGANSATSINSADMPAELARIGMVVVVNPYRCEERLLAAAGVEIHDATGVLVPRAQREALSSEHVTRVLPGTALPAGAKAFVYQLPRPRSNDVIVASYAEDGCEVQGKVLRGAVEFTPAKLIDAPPPAIPKDASGPATVFLQAIVDFEGRFQQPVYIGGPGELETAAREAIGHWRAEPARMNGAPVAGGVLLQVRFGPR